MPQLKSVLWLALLVSASVAFTLGLACAMPLAALGAAVALTLSRRDALLVTGAAWLANQLCGFTFLNYPWTANTVEWGFALGVVACLTTLAAQGLVRRLDGRSAIAVAVATFAGAFVVYEGALFVVAAILLGGTEDFVPSIVVRIFTINSGAFAGLLLLHWLGRAVGLATRIDPSAGAVLQST